MSNWMKSMLAALLLGWSAGPGRAAPGDPSQYLRKSSWHESLLASLVAVARSDLEHGFASFVSETMRGGDAAREIRVPLDGAKELYLAVDGVPDVKWGVADWADARLIRVDGTTEPLTCRSLFTADDGVAKEDWCSARRRTTAA